MTSSDAANTARTLTMHPLAPLAADEIDLCRETCITAGLVRETTRIAYMGLEEPSKADVTQWTPDTFVERQARLFLLDMASGRGEDVILSLSSRSVVRVREIDPRKDGQLPIVAEEFELVDQIVKADHGWCAAMEARGIVDVSLVRPCPLSAGAFDIDGESGRRMLRVLSFLAHRDEDHCWAHPIDGVVAYVDLTERKVVELIDHEKLPIPGEEGNFDDPTYVGPVRMTLKPIEITQPDGPS